MIWNNRVEFEITKLQWERIFLNIEIETNYIGEVEFAFSKFKRHNLQKLEAKEKGVEVEDLFSEDEVPEYEFEFEEKNVINWDKYENGKYYFSINISAVANREFLDNGKWRITAEMEDGIAVVNVSKDIAYNLGEYSRVFPYGKDKYAYIMSFDLRNFRGESLELYFNSRFVMENKKWRKRKYVQEARSKKGKIKNFYKAIVIKNIWLFYNVVSFFTPKNGKNILFMSETKDFIWGNLKVIHDRIYERGLDSQFKIKVHARKSVGAKQSIFSWIRTVFLIARSNYIFIDDYAPIFGFFKLKKKTKLVQVWHAGEGFKSVGFSRFGKTGSPFPTSCHKAYDYAVTGSKNLIKVYEEVFGIEKEAFLPVGMARLDGFLDENKIEKFKGEFYKEYPKLKDRKVILFAPTFRGAGQKSTYYDLDMINLDEVYKFCDEKWAFVIKLHPFIDQGFEIPEEYRDRIFDLGEYKDINDLYYITDVLVTDYSSNYYDYALLEKPVIFYTYDREFYELTRGVHRGVKEHAPGKVVETFEEFIEALKNEDFEEEKIKKFTDENFGEYTGNSADKAIDIILLKEEAGK